MDCSTPGFLVHHQLPEPTQTHVHRISDAIQPSQEFRHIASTQEVIVAIVMNNNYYPTQEAPERVRSDPTYTQWPLIFLKGT